MLASLREHAISQRELPARRSASTGRSPSSTRRILQAALHSIGALYCSGQRSTKQTRSSLLPLWISTKREST